VDEENEMATVTFKPQFMLTLDSRELRLIRLTLGGRLRPELVEEARTLEAHIAKTQNDATQTFAEQMQRLADNVDSQQTVKSSTRQAVLREGAAMTLRYDGDYCEAPKDKDGDYLGDAWVCDFFDGCGGNADVCSRYQQDLDVDKNSRVKRCDACHRAEVSTELA
jgi:hypothetical protein